MIAKVPGRMWVKICANTSADDALFAAEAGADAVGFVFAPSVRRVTAEQVAVMTSKLETDYPDVLRVGVFHEPDGEHIAATVRAARLTGVQLHGAFSQAVVDSLRERLGPDVLLVQTNHWRVDDQAPETFEQSLRELSRAPHVDAVLVDSRTAVAGGGTGVAFDWEKARDAMKALGGRPLIVAGGLHPGNVAEAIAVLRPWGVDVASGVESAPGKKDHARVRAFILNARRTQADKLER